MFKLFRKKKEKLEPKFVRVIGRWYSLARTEYSNDFDYIRMFERHEYDNGAIKDICIGIEQFLPSMFEDDDNEIAFIEKLRKQGFVQKYELNMKK